MLVVPFPPRYRNVPPQAGKGQFFIPASPGMRYIAISARDRPAPGEFLRVLKEIGR